MNLFNRIGAALDSGLSATAKAAKDFTAGVKVGMELHKQLRTDDVIQQRKALLQNQAARNIEMAEIERNAAKHAEYIAAKKAKLEADIAAAQAKLAELSE